MGDFYAVENGIRQVLARYLLRGAGLAILLLSAALAASLATWHADDPSLSYAAEFPVRNLLGSPGAISPIWRCNSSALPLSASSSRS